VTTTHRTPAPFVRLASAILALAALLVAMVVTASPASAHARLEASSPKDGSTLTATPPEVMLQFNEQIKEGLNQISVKSGSTDATEGKPEVDGNTVYQPLKSSLAAGDYTVSYKVVSADGHPISGTLSFTYTPPTGDEGAVDTPTSSAPGTSGSSTAPSASSPGSATSSAPGSTTAPPSSSSSAPASSATSATDGETQPTAPASTSSSSSSAAAPTDGDEGSSNDEGLPTWVWIAGLGVLLVLLAAAGLIARGRGRGSNDEDIDLDEWRG
jgi:methionine-rich copper-binding protein CopC